MVQDILHIDHAYDESGRVQHRDCHMVGPAVSIDEVLEYMKVLKPLNLIRQDLHNGTRPISWD